MSHIPGSDDDSDDVKKKLDEIEKMATGASATTSTRVEKRPSFGSFISSMFGKTKDSGKESLNLLALEKEYKAADQFIKSYYDVADEENSTENEYLQDLYKRIEFLQTLELVTNVLPQDINALKNYDQHKMRAESSELAKNFVLQLDAGDDTKNKISNNIIKNFKLLLPLYEQLNILVNNHEQNKDENVRIDALEKQVQALENIKDYTAPLYAFAEQLDQHLHSCNEYLDALKNVDTPDENKIAETEETRRRIVKTQNLIDPIEHLENIGKFNDEIIDQVRPTTSQSNDL